MRRKKTDIYTNQMSDVSQRFGFIDLKTMALYCLLFESENEIYICFRIQ